MSPPRWNRRSPPVSTTDKSPRIDFSCPPVYCDLSGMPNYLKADSGVQYRVPGATTGTSKSVSRLGGILPQGSAETESLFCTNAGRLLPPFYCDTERYLDILQACPIISCHDSSSFALGAVHLLCTKRFDGRYASRYTE